MEKEIKLILKIVFLFTAITSSFSLISRVSPALFAQGLIDGWRKIFILNSFWLIMVVIILCVLAYYFKKRNINFKEDFLINKTVLLSTGIFLTIDGIITLSNSIIVRVMSILSLSNIPQQADNMASRMRQNVLISSIIPVVIMLLQIVLGIIMIKSNKQREDQSE